MAGEARYTLMLSVRSEDLRITVYDAEGRRLEERIVEGERVELRGAMAIEVVRGLREYGVVARYNTRPCVHVKNGGVIVEPCRAGGGEE